MGLRINDTAPDFTAETTEGAINFHEWIGNGWALLFSHPKDFTPVCTTELSAAAALKDEFAARNCKIIGISVDGVDEHAAWSKDIESFGGVALNYPLIGDPALKIVKAYDMLPADAGDTSEGRTAGDNVPQGHPVLPRIGPTSAESSSSCRLSPGHDHITQLRPKSSRRILGRSGFSDDDGPSKHLAVGYDDLVYAIGPLL